VFSWPEIKAGASRFDCRNPPAFPSRIARRYWFSVGDATMFSFM
jgi:hypothetical protein